jgi:phosphoesterase RecJ-like protein
MGTFEEIATHLKKAQNILVLLHNFPDGDTIASSLALSAYLRAVNKKVDCAVKGDIPEVFNFLPGISEIKNDFLLGDYDLIIAVDCGDANRTGFPERLEQVCKNKPLINIDHHLRNNLYKIAKVNLVDDRASAAAEIIFRLLRYLGAEIDGRIATYILAGIYYDTGGFHHPNVTVDTLKIASECLHLGGRIGLVSQNLSFSRRSSALKLWGVALRKMQIREDGIVVACLTREDLTQCKASEDDASGIVNLINTLPDTKIAILLVETEAGKIKASLRTESDEIDVSRLARLFEGGGHKKAAGFVTDKLDLEL